MKRYDDISEDVKMSMKRRDEKMIYIYIYIFMLLMNKINSYCNYLVWRGK